MPDKRNYFKQKRCDGCGNLLRWSTQKGYYCEWCGYSDIEYFEDFVDEKVDEPLPDTPTYHTPKTNIGLKVAIILSAIGVFLCVIMVVAGSITSTSTTRKPNTSSSSSNSSVEKPQMLTTLPKAVKAGTAVAYKNWEIVVSPEFTVSNNRLAFAFSIQNWHDNNQILSYEPKTIIVYDNAGKVYPINLGSCAPDLPYLTRQLTFLPNEKMSFTSNTSWCNRDTNIPTYSGVIPQDVSNLYFHFEDFGVFKNIIFVFDL
jgi:hypothetical protein